MAYVDLNNIDDPKIRQLINTGAPEYSTRYVTKTDSALEMLAHRRGIHDTDYISVDDDGHVTNSEVELWWIYWYCQYVFETKIGMNDIRDGNTDLYVYKADLYAKKLSMQSKRVTRYSLIDEIERIGQAATGSVSIQRG